MAISAPSPDSEGENCGRTPVFLLREDPGELEEPAVDRLRPAGDLVERSRGERVADEPDEHAARAVRELIDRGGAEAGGKHAVGGGGHTASDDVPERRETQAEADRAAVLLEIVEHHLRVVLRAFG